MDSFIPKHLKTHVCHSAVNKPQQLTERLRSILYTNDYIAAL